LFLARRRFQTHQARIRKDLTGLTVVQKNSPDSMQINTEHRNGITYDAFLTAQALVQSPLLHPQ